ncbi:Exportin-7, partial [Operophtera brumata]
MSGLAGASRLQLLAAAGCHNPRETDQQRLDIRNYVLNYLATRPKLASFTIQALVALFARITKLSWFDMIKDEYVFQN